MIHAYRGVMPRIRQRQWGGLSAKVRRSVTAEDLDLIRRSAQNYIRLLAEYKTSEGA